MCRPDDLVVGAVSDRSATFGVAWHPVPGDFGGNFDKDATCLVDRLDPDSAGWTGDKPGAVTSEGCVRFREDDQAGGGESRQP